MFDRAEVYLGYTDHVHRQPAQPGCSNESVRRESLAFNRPAIALAIAGGLLTGGLAGAALFSNSSATTEAGLDQVAVGDIDAAAQSLLPVSAAALAEEAKACRKPLAVITLLGTGPNGGTVRIRSGVYVTPNIRVGRGSASRLALPYPEPFQVGHGRLYIESATDGIDAFIQPGVRIRSGMRTTVADVTWSTNAACKGSTP